MKLLNLPLFVALRYLRSKRTVNIINMVSQISLVGVICGTAALMVVLSVFNGFESLTRSIYGTFDPELKITPKEGKTFVVDSVKISLILSLDEVENVSLSLDENVLIQHGGQQTIALLRGVSAGYESNTPIDAYMYAGEFKTHIKKSPSLVLGYGVAAKLGIYGLSNESPILVHVPKRTGAVSLNNPAKSLSSMEIPASGIFEIEKNIDETYAFAPIEFMQELLERESQASAMEIKLKAGIDADKTGALLSEIVGEEMSVKTRFQQNETMYRMMKSEKLIVYAILILIVVILSFNISGSLSMLMTEKKDDIATLKSLGASDQLIRRIFLRVGMLITVSGVAAGLAVGLFLCVMQQRFGLLKLPGSNMLVNAYPVQVIPSDIALVIGSVVVIGCFASFISTFEYKKKR